MWPLLFGCLCCSVGLGEQLVQADPAQAQVLVKAEAGDMQEYPVSGVVVSLAKELELSEPEGGEAVAVAQEAKAKTSGCCQIDEEDGGGCRPAG